MPSERWKRIDEWLTSTRSAKLFFASTFVVLASVPLIEGWIDVARMTLWMRTCWTIFAMLATLSLLFLWFGMWGYWLRLDSSTAGAKRLWFMVLLLGFWYGSCVYCYVVYLPQVIRRSRIKA